MARSIDVIASDILTAVGNDGVLGSLLTNTSAVAAWRSWAYIMAGAVWLLEVLLDDFRAEITALVANEKAHTLRWYAQKALGYQHGSTLVDGQDYYDNSVLSAAQVAALKIVKAASAAEANGLVVVKVAKEGSTGLLGPLNVVEYTALNNYMQDIKDAGVSLSVLSASADKLKLSVDVYYDATVLSSFGARLDGTGSAPIQDAIKAFLKAIPFDGVFIKSRLVDAIQAVGGVVVPEVRLCQARLSSSGTYASIDVFYSPYSGYLVFNNESTDLSLTFIAV